MQSDAYEPTVCSIIKQFDVGMSPPAFSFTFIVTLTFDLDLMNFFLASFFLVVVPDGRTDRRTDGRTDGRTEGDAYEPTVHEHRWAQKQGILAQVCVGVGAPSRFIKTHPGSGTQVPKQVPLVNLNMAPSRPPFVLCVRGRCSEQL